MILILEDDRLVAASLKRMVSLAAPEQVVFVVAHAHEANDLLRAHVFDLAILDHDLGVEPTGRDVTRFIAFLADAQRPRAAIVNSGNPVGGAHMAQDLIDARVPTLLRLKDIRINDIRWAFPGAGKTS